MGNRWLKVILAASLALNLAFVSHFVYRYVFAEHTKDTPPMKEIKVETALELQTEQKKEIDSIIKKFRINKSKYKQDILEKRMDIIDELGVPDFDLENIKTKTDELNELESRLNLDFVDTLIRITNILDTKQRLNFLYSLSKNWFFIQRRPR
jgi:Spy/CpxP family protein refolding chaperone